MLLLGRHWRTFDLPPTTHRTRTMQDCRRQWWWHCRACGDYGCDASWSRVLINAHRHAQGLPTTG